MHQNLYVIVSHDNFPNFFKLLLFIPVFHIHNTTVIWECSVNVSLCNLVRNDYILIPNAESIDEWLYSLAHHISLSLTCIIPYTVLVFTLYMLIVVRYAVDWVSSAVIFFCWLSGCISAFPIPTTFKLNHTSSPPSFVDHWLQVDVQLYSIIFSKYICQVIQMLPPTGFPYWLDYHHQVNF